MTREQPTLVPLYSESSNYREWVTDIAGTAYTIVQEGPVWTLLQAMPPSEAFASSDWRQVGGEQAVEWFLATHNLSLAPGARGED